MTRVLVLGATGMAGHVIALHLIEVGYDVSTFSRKSCRVGTNIVGDVLDLPFLSKTIEEGNFDYVINCIGILNRDAEDHPSKAIWVNSFLPHYIADKIKELPTRLIQMSTDCVFAGNTGPYTENSIPDGTTMYDRTKALGEVNDSKNLTFRNSIIGPDIDPKGIGLLNWFLKQAGEINGYSHAIWTGVTTLTLAKAMDRAMQCNVTGLINLVNNTSISKFDLLCLFNTYFRNNQHTIIPIEQPYLDKTLLSTRSDFDFPVPSYEQMISELSTWVSAHTSIYSSNPTTIPQT